MGIEIGIHKIFSQLRLKTDKNISAEKLSELLVSEPEKAITTILILLDRLINNSNVKSRSLIFFIDQFEQVFTWSKNEQNSFLNLLEAFISSNYPGCSTFVIGTIRSDFRHELAMSPKMSRMLGIDQVRSHGETESVIDIAPPVAADLRDMILGPAQSAGLSYEVSSDGRDLRLELEKQANPDALPALQFLLFELYKRKQGNLLTLKAFDELGGIAGVLANQGNETLDSLPPKVRKAFPRVARALVKKISDQVPTTSKPIPDGRFEANSPETSVINALTDASLLIKGNGHTRVIHESILTGWNKFHEIITDRQIRVRDRLVEQFRRYSSAKSREYKRGLLLTGVPLTEGKELLAAWGNESVSDEHQGLPEYIKHSSTVDWFQRLQKQILVFSTIVVLVSSGFGIWWFKLNAQASKLESEVRLLLSRADAALRKGDGEKAAHHAFQALEKDNSISTRSALIEALSIASPYAELTVSSRLQDIAWLNNSLIAIDAKGRHQSIKITIEDTSQKVHKVPKLRNTEENIFKTFFRKNGEIVEFTENGQVSISNYKENKSVLIKGDDDILFSSHNQISMAMNKNGFVVGFIGANNKPTVQNCDSKSCQKISLMPLEVDEATAISISTNSQNLAVAFLLNGQSHVLLQNLKTGDKFTLPINTSHEVSKDQSFIQSVALSPEGTKLGIGLSNGSISVYQQHSGNWKQVLRAFPKYVAKF